MGGMVKKASLSWLVFLFFAAAFVIGGLSCKTKAKDVKKAAQPRQTIRISGSGTCLPLVKLIAQAFQEKNPNIEVKFLPSGHSKAGISGVDQGILEIGAVSRRLKPTEKVLGVNYYCLSNDGLAIGTSKGLDIKGITSEAVRKIYSGEITNWQELGGPDAEIVVLDRNEDESAKIILRQYVLGKNLKITPQAINLYFESDMINAVEETSYAIGYFSLGYALSENLDINLLELDGVAPTVENILAGKYRMVRPLGIVTKKEGEAVRKFVEFALSSEAKETMKENGFAPCPENQ
jgi:phosphate transport system substrate-binding protein